AEAGAGRHRGGLCGHRPANSMPVRAADTAPSTLARLLGRQQDQTHAAPAARSRVAVVLGRNELKPFPEKPLLELAVLDDRLQPAARSRQTSVLQEGAVDGVSGDDRTDGVGVRPLPLGDREVATEKLPPESSVLKLRIFAAWFAPVARLRSWGTCHVIFVYSPSS